MIQVGVRGIGLLSPGLPGWPAGRAVLGGRQPFHPDSMPEPEAALLPPNERRRSSDCVRWAVEVAQEAVVQSGLDPQDMATVFASSGGETSVLDQLCRILAAPDRLMSPTLFHQSVHNTAAGYWGIATKCRQSSTALSAYDDSFAAGLLDAVTSVGVEERAVLLVAYDLPPPAPLFQARPIRVGFATALVLTPPSDKQRGSLAVQIERANGHPPTPVEDGQLEWLRVETPAARSLPLLVALARGGTALVRLDLLGDQRLAIEVAS